MGFDLYIRLVGEAVANFRGESQEEEPEMRIELPVDAHIPTDYVEHERLRLEAYRKLAAAGEEKQIRSVLEELTDRYGTPPDAVGVLADVARLRIRARKSGVSDIVSQGNFIRFGPVEDLPDSQIARLKRMYPKSLIKPAVRSVLVPKPVSGGGFDSREVVDSEILTWAHQFLEAIMPVEDEETESLESAASASS